MRVAMIGLGNFAERAYLDHLAGRTDIELHLVTRDPQRLTELGDRYRIRDRHRHWQDLANRDFDAAFVHTATPAHAEIVSGLLRAGVPVCVDKPLDDTYESARALVELAESVGQSLMVAFNRRWAPTYTEVLNSSRRVITLHKHRVGLPTDLRQFVFGDFIHIVDTLRFLAPGPVTNHAVQVHMDGSAPQMVSLHLAGTDFFALGTTHRIESGSSEILECVGSDGLSHRVDDLDRITIRRGSSATVTDRGMWTRTPWQRGIEQMVDGFLGAVNRGEVLSARDALVTHQWCEEIVAAAQS